MDPARLLFPLLLFGHFASALPSAGVDTDTDIDFDCVNDFIEDMTCQLEQQNCSEYNLSLVLINGGDMSSERSCIFQQCGTGLCCCSMKTILIHGEIHTATVWKERERFVSKNISVTESIKPTPPTNVKVNKSNENFKVLWKANMNDNSLYPEGTYYVKGKTETNVSRFTSQVRENGWWFYEITGQELEPSTTYVVSVSMCSKHSNKCSDSSKELEFKTGASRSSILWAIILSLSFVAALTCFAIFSCYVKLKTNLWDKYSNKKPLMLSPWQTSKTPILKVEELKTSSVCIDPPNPDVIKPGSKMIWTGSEDSGSFQSSGISTGSSHLSYAETEPLDVKTTVQDALKKDLSIFNISPVSLTATSPFQELNKESVSVSSFYNSCDVKAQETSSGSSGLTNPSYSLIIPTFANPSEVQMQSEMVCDPDYSLSKNNIMDSPEPQVLACPFPAQTDISFPVQTDMSYQQCSVNPQRFSDTEDCSLLSNSSGTGTTISPELESKVELGGATKLTAMIDNLPTCAVSHSFIEMEDDYQPIKSLAEEMEVLVSEGTCGNHMENLETYPEESFTKISFNCSGLFSPGFINDAQSGPPPLERQSPFPPVMSAGQSPPVITDSGYQSV